MKNSKQHLLQQALEKRAENKASREQDPYRLWFHLMPPAGLLNDPNGLIEFQGVYHVFYQWNPFDTAHGAKFWGHFTSADFVYWEEQLPALVPGDWFDQNGCYSGSAIEADGELLLFYTGNVKHENGKRDTYQCMASSKDGLHFRKNGPVLLLPAGYTPHFRDPKVWQEGGVSYMVIGAQTTSKEGRVVLFSSSNLHDWVLEGELAGSGLNGLTNFGYMWECPDFFRLGDEHVLLVSPQGLEPDEYRYQNEFQSGYLIGQWQTGTALFSHGAFQEMDRGFDFYAPQTFQDKAGRRILFAWMGMTDEQEANQPTIQNGWVHALTIPRQLFASGGRLVQKPVPELKQLRSVKELEGYIDAGSEPAVFPTNGPASEWKMIFEAGAAETVELLIRSCVKIVFDPKKKQLTMTRRAFQSNRAESRSCPLDKLVDLQLFLDASSIELFVNGGEEVFTARFFPDPAEQSVCLQSGKLTRVFLEKWTLARNIP